MNWVILNVQTGEFWSNKWGWGSRHGADIYTTTEMRTLRLPIDGWWVPAITEGE